MKVLFESIDPDPSRSRKPRNRNFNSMINPQTIDLSTLPSLPLANRRQLPNCPAIYFVMEGDRILYIGSSSKLAQRWTAHHRYNQLKGMESIRLAWFECSDTSLLAEIEKALIEWFNPLMNGSAVTTDKKRISLYVEEELKSTLEALAKARKRSLSNLIEVICQEAVDKALSNGELNDVSFHHPRSN